MKFLILFVLIFSFSYALQCRYENVNNRQVCVCRERTNVFIVDDSYCSSSCPCDISQVLQSFTDKLSNVPLVQFLTGFRLNVQDTPPPVIQVNLPPFINTTIDLAQNPLMNLLLSVMRISWIAFATILSYFIIFRR